MVFIIQINYDGLLAKILNSVNEVKNSLEPFLCSYSHSYNAPRFYFAVRFCALFSLDDIVSVATCSASKEPFYKYTEKS